MAEPFAGAQPETVPWAVIDAPGLPTASSCLTSPVALVTTPLGEGTVPVGAFEDSVVVVAVEAAVVEELLDDAGRFEEPHPATPSAIPTRTIRAIDRVGLDIRENISHGVSSQTQAKAKPVPSTLGSGCVR